MLDWLKDAIIYQIYPISFYDSNGDGMGDLRGIAEKADYIKSLGVDAVWLNPIFKSPFKDGGYDISDYMEIDKRFGTMDDLAYLIRVFKEKGIRIILDLVIGHTSDKHPWFKNSAKAKRNKYSDYYIWTDSLFRDYPKAILGLYKRDGGYIPNYYASQPALNYGFETLDEENPWKIHYKDERLRPLREELMDIMRHYLDMGIDGFRIDLAGTLVKGGRGFDEKYLYDDTTDGLSGITWFWNTVLGTLRNEYQDKVFIAEWVLPQRSISMCGFDVDFMTHDTIAFNTLYRNEKGTNLLPFFERGFNYFSPEGKGDLKEFVKYLNFVYGDIKDKGMFTAPTGTHDEIRMSTNRSKDMVKTMFAFLLSLKQVPFIYYGDEIGLEHNFTLSKDGGGIRTGARTPMQWTEEKGRGFSSKKTTYLPVSKKVGQSVEFEESDKDSILNTVKELIRIRHKYPCLAADADQIFLKTGYPAIFERSKDGQTIQVYVNPSDREIRINAPKGETIISQNVGLTGTKMTMKKQSFILILKS